MLRIGELSRRVGIRAATLRAWERRYGLFEPARTGGNYRLYSAVDEARALAMTELLATGVSAAEAAELARAGRRSAERSGVAAAQARSAPRTKAGPIVIYPAQAAGAAAGAAAESTSTASPTPAQTTKKLVGAIEAYDDAAATAVLDEAIAGLSVDAVLSNVMLPALREVGERWTRGEISIAQEHFGSELLRGRLLGLARRWGAGTGPLALLACPPGERHELGLLAFGLTLRGRGWRIAYLGADTPVETLASAAEGLDPALVVVAAADPEHFEAALPELRTLAERQPVVVGGAAASEELARTLGAAYRGDDAVGAAQSIAADAEPPAHSVGNGRESPQRRQDSSDPPVRRAR